MSYTIAEEFVLPSKGLVYGRTVNPNVKLRSMTTVEEMKRLSPSERQYKNLCEVIDDCLVEKPGISAYDMCLADYQYLLHKLRIVTYGSSYRIMTACPGCGFTHEVNMNLDSFTVTEYEEHMKDELTFTLPQTKKEVTIRLQTPRMIDDINAKVNERKKKAKGATIDNTLSLTIQHLIHSVDGVKLDAVKIEDFVNDLPMMDTNYIIKKAEKLVERFGLNPYEEEVCPLCGLVYDNYFRLTSEFFGPSVD